jgi:hypothetical protein
METGKYEAKRVKGNPERFITVWSEDGVLIQNGPQMTEAELRAALRMNFGRSEAEINRVIDEAEIIAA